MYYTSCTVTRSYASPWRPYVMRSRGPNNVGWVMQMVQHCRATLQLSRNKRNVGGCWLKNLTSFKLQQQLPATRNDIQKGVQTDATCNTQQYWELLHGNVASDCADLKCDISVALSLNRHVLGRFIRVPIVCFFSIGCLYSPLFPFRIILVWKS